MIRDSGRTSNRHIGPTVNTSRLVGTDPHVAISITSGPTIRLVATQIFRRCDSLQDL
jgi:hypothetical protein